MRKLVTIETIAAVHPIPDADAIEAVTVRGWTVVSKKGDFAAGTPCVYFEIDSQLPLTDARFAFLAPRGERTLGDGTKVHVLKTARLRGVYSQGLVLPLADFPELVDRSPDEDLAALLGVEKWEAPVPAGAEEVIGEFPTALARKTDAERVQNLVDVFDRLRAEYLWVATEKVDGTSATFARVEGALRVCGRNWELSAERSLHGRMAARLGLAEKLREGDVVQGEIYGEGVQGNPLKVRGTHLAVFAFFQERTALPRAEWPSWALDLSVPAVDLVLPHSVEAAVAQVDGMQSVVSPGRLAEGVVWHTSDGRAVPELDYRSGFKAISNKYLLKH